MLTDHILNLYLKDCLAFNFFSNEDKKLGEKNGVAIKSMHGL